MPAKRNRSWAAPPSVRNATYLFTDAEEPDPALVRLAGGASHWVNTGCDAQRGRGLCCKTDAELWSFIDRLRATPRAEKARRPHWWCHVDDDNYVMLPALRRFLNSSQMFGAWAREPCARACGTLARRPPLPGTP